MRAASKRRQITHLALRREALPVPRVDGKHLTHLTPITDWMRLFLLDIPESPTRAENFKERAARKRVHVLPHRIRTMYTPLLLPKSPSSGHSFPLDGTYRRRAGLVATRGPCRHDVGTPNTLTPLLLHRSGTTVPEYERARHQSSFAGDVFVTRADSTRSSSPTCIQPLVYRAACHVNRKLPMYIHLPASGVTAIPSMVPTDIDLRHGCASS